MTINLPKANLLNSGQFLQIIKPISIGCAALAIAGLSLSPLIINKSTEKVEITEEKVEQESTTLPPAVYTIIMGNNKDEVIIKFHNQKSELYLKNISTTEYNCLLSGGGINCVLQQAYQPKLEVTEAPTEPTPKQAIKQQSFQLPEVKISKDTRDSITVAAGVGLFFLVLRLWRR